jgi:hypothetical protein
MKTTNAKTTVIIPNTSCWQFAKGQILWLAVDAEGCGRFLPFNTHSLKLNAQLWTQYGCQNFGRVAQTTGPIS